ncbi:MAG: O-antigen ligase family protein [Thermoleophilia bacterium]
MTTLPVKTAEPFMPVSNSEPRRSYMAALVSISFLLAGTLLYPDYLVSVGLRVGPVRVSPMGLLFVLAAPSVSWYFWKQKATLKYSAVDIVLVIAFLFVGIRGALAATNGNELGLVVGYIGYALLLYYGTAVVGQKRGALRTLFMVLVSMGVIAAVYAVVEFALDRNILYEGIIKESMVPFPGVGYHRSGSTLGHPVVLGAFMVQVIPIFLFFFIRAGTAVRKAVWGAGIVLLMLALTMTFSKGAWSTAGILLISGLIWLIWRRPASTRPLLFLLTAVVLVLGVFTAVFNETVHAGTLSKARTGESFNPRIYMWSRVPNTFLANPLVGAGMWQGNKEVFEVNPAPEAKNRPISIDNIYLVALVEQGALGVLLVGAALTLIGIQAWKLLRRGSSLTAWGLPVAVSMTMILINGYAMSSLMIWPNMVVFWLCAGMVRALAERSSEMHV